VPQALEAARDGRNGAVLTVVDPLDLAIDTLGYRDSEGLVQGETRDGASARAFVWRELRRKADLDAAYFRGAVPLVVFARAENDDQIPSIHRRLWNLSRVPLLIAGTPDSVGVYSCFSGPTETLSAKAAELRVATTRDDIPKLLAEFSRFHVESGRLATERPSYFQRQKRVDRRLLDNLQQLRHVLGGDSGRRRAVDALIGRSMFVRYFEDRGILSPDHFAELTPYSSFIEVLDAGRDAAYGLFAALLDRFNGDVFGAIDTEVESVEDRDLRTVADFFRGMNFKTGQTTLWPYDFSVIPPELISSIYEQLLEESQRRDAAYYTPRHVVDLILDEVLPWEQPRRPSVLDPACGSGIFLTEAYRRLAFRLVTESKDRPTFAQLAHLLTTSIFGIDRSEAAVNVAAFGLYLALLEELDPPSAWRDAKLPKLTDRNLVVADYFSAHSLEGRRFDVIVGNPPWQSQLTPDAETFVSRTGLPVADRQAAHAFLWRASQMLSKDGVLGLLLPSKALLHNKGSRAIEVRRQLFESLDVETVIDLSALRRETFHAAVAPAAVLIARPRGQLEPVDDEVLHVVPRASPLQASLDGFVVSQDDVHRITQGVALSYPDVWKIYLWGAAQDFGVVTRLRSLHRPLSAIVRERRWIYGQGFQVKGGDRNVADEIAGLTFIPTESVQRFCIDPASSAVVSDIVMHRPRDHRLYQGPHLLVRRGLVRGRPAAALVRDDAAFNNGVLGFAAPSEDLNYLKLLAGYLNSSLGSYYHFLTSSSWGVERDFIEENEHLALPFAEPSPKLVAQVIRAVDNAERSPHDGAWQKRLDEAVFEAYELNAHEVDLVYDTLISGLNQFERRSQSTAFRPPSGAALADYMDTMRETLSGTARSLEVRVWLSRQTPAFAAVSVTFSERQDRSAERLPAEQAPSVVEALFSTLQAAADDQPSPVTIMQPAAVVMQDNEVHVVKPNESRYWTVSKARADAGEILGHIATVQPSVP
jgi:SAM-dependent methyltransferase